ncbi:MAG: AMP-binding protein, partial [Pseudomonadota bacterium]
MVPPDSQLLLHRQFEEQVRKTPDDLALYEAERTITFTDLDARANRIFDALRAEGIGDGCMVGLHIERSIDWVAGALAILKANAAVVPLPPSYPADRHREILTHAALDMVIDNANTPLDRSQPVQAMSITELSPIGSAPDNTLSGHLDQAAFVLCSSGSTGRPKMIVRSHRSFLHRLRWTWEQHPFSPGEVCLQKAPATTTHSIYELFEPLLRGVPVIIVPDDDVRNLELFWELIRARGVSRLLIVPSMLQASLEMPGFEAPQIKVLILMGEYVPAVLAEKTIATFPEQTHLYSIYGSTEASSTLVCDLRESWHPDVELPLGTPISPNVRTMVLGPDLEPVAPGDTGLLYIEGDALFTEYFRDPDLTGSALINSPEQSTTLYDTRDQVRTLLDGNLQFVGRVDDTVKIRGFRVELQEVESAILLNADVCQVAVVASGNQAGSTTLLAFFTPANVDHSSIYETLESRLPTYMIPATLIGLDEFPLTTNRKLDRTRLLEEYASRRYDPTPGGSMSDTERQVSDAWAQTLGHPGFALDSNFFEVGGTSLTVFALVNRLRQAFSLQPAQLSAESVYQFPSITTLAESIDNIRTGRPQSETSGTPLLVTLRTGSDATLPPFFVIHSAGGTLGAYQKLASSLTTARDIVGVRDPFNFGERDPTEGFQHWVGRYIEAICERQPYGPYYVGAYSSAGAIGYEIATQLKQKGEDVALLALIDPLAIDRRNRWRYGWWAMRAVSERSPIRALVKLVGWLRIPMVRGLGALSQARAPNNDALSVEEYRLMAEDAMHRKNHLMSLAALLELNTGLPFTLTEADFSQSSPDEFFNVLRVRFASLMPEVDPASIERIVIQYFLQTKAQRDYVLQPYMWRGPAGSHPLPATPAAQARAGPGRGLARFRHGRPVPGPGSPDRRPSPTHRRHLLELEPRTIGGPGIDDSPAAESQGRVVVGIVPHHDPE